MSFSNLAERFDSVWAIDFEFRAKDGCGTQHVVCLVAKDLLSGKILRLWENELLAGNPFGDMSKSCFVAYSFTAEMSCFNLLGWSNPEHMIDLYPEFLNISNVGAKGFQRPHGRGLLGALAWFGVTSISQTSKDEMIRLILNNKNYSADQKARILSYCEEDVVALEKLLPHILSQPCFSLDHALIRGRYMRALAQVEQKGIPVDAEIHRKIVTHWPEIKRTLISDIDKDYGVYRRGSFHQKFFERYLESQGIEDWPRTPMGYLCTDDDTFKEMASLHPQLMFLRQLKKTINDVKPESLQIGDDGRNRCSLMPFGSKTSRNQPSGNKYIYGPAKWMRNLIRPSAGMALAYIDWSQQEFGIAAALSQDEAMKSAYNSADPYLAFARIVNAVPEGATKETHGSQRELFKQAALGVQYQMGAPKLAKNIGSSVSDARHLLAYHRKAFPTFWKWSESVADYALLNGRLHTTFGWNLHVTDTTGVPTIKNFPMQANAAEMLRLACILAVERGVKVCGTLHDAILVEAPESELSRVIELAQQCMAESSKIILGGFELKTDVKVCTHSSRFEIPEGHRMWTIIQRLIAKYN